MTSNIRICSFHPLVTTDWHHTEAAYREDM